MKRFPLDARALRYIEGILGVGGGLSQRILRAVRLDDGEATIWLPESASLTDLYAFREGGKLPRFPPMKPTGSAPAAAVSSTEAWLRARYEQPDEVGVQRVDLRECGRRA